MLSASVYLFLSISVSFAAAQSTFSGDLTYYYPEGGYGACGTVLQNTDMICALNFAHYDAVGCGKCLEVSGPKGKIVVKVMDKCAGCKYGDIDLSHSAFLHVADEAYGRVSGTGVIVDCKSGVADPNQPKLNLTVTSPAPIPAAAHLVPAPISANSAAAVNPAAPVPAPASSSIVPVVTPVIASASTSVVVAIPISCTISTTSTPCETSSTIASSIPTSAPQNASAVVDPCTTSTTQPAYGASVAPISYAVDPVATCTPSPRIAAETAERLTSYSAAETSFQMSAHALLLLVSFQLL